MCSCDNTSPLKEGKSSRNIKFDSRLDHTTSSLMFPQAFRPRGTVTFPFPRWWLHRAGMRFFRAALRFGQSPSSRVELGWKDNCKRQRGSSANLPADVNTPLWRGPNVSNLTVNGKLKKKLHDFSRSQGDRTRFMVCYDLCYTMVRAQVSRDPASWWMGGPPRVPGAAARTSLLFRGNGSSAKESNQGTEFPFVFTSGMRCRAVFGRLSIADNLQKLLWKAFKIVPDSEL